MRVKWLCKAHSVSAQSARRFPEEVRITLHAPQALSASFRPSTAPWPALLRQKGAFLPPMPAKPAPGGRPNASFRPGEAWFCPAAPGKRRSGSRFCPGPRRPRTPLGPRKPPACAAFLPACARFRPPCAARTPEGCPVRRRNHLAVRRPNARCRRPPPEGQPAAPPRHSLGAGNPDCRGRLSRFAVKKCATPRGESDPWA